LLGAFLGAGAERLTAFGGLGLEGAGEDLLGADTFGALAGRRGALGWLRFWLGAGFAAERCLDLAAAEPLSRFFGWAAKTDAARKTSEQTKTAVMAKELFFFITIHMVYFLSC